MKYSTVYKFNCWWETDVQLSKENEDYMIEHHYRYVVAETEEEAVKKMEKHVRALKKEGYDTLHFYPDAVIDNYCVIA